jgi:hypothetical protein
VHYESGIFGTRSVVDDPRFFASPRGPRDPEAELEATLRAFLAPAEPRAEAASTEGTPAEDAAPPTKHPVCRFVARWEWLRDRLAIDESRVPLARCEPFETLYADLRPEAVSLIFPTSHMNSPASMFGHTLLTVGAASETSLLSHAINYSAVTDETFGPFYIAKGLLGLYPGYFSILPYYAKIQEYSDVNDRDIWEYPLELDAREIRRLLLHLYELENVNSNYYFFGENCSYHILYLLEAAREGLELTDRFGWWVIPLDTIRAVEESGLVRDAVYRPSKSTKISHVASLLPDRARKEARRIALGSLAPDDLLSEGTDRVEKIRICDLAGEYLQYAHAKGEIGKDVYVPRFLATLRARSRLGESEEGRYTIPAPVRPDRGHLSGRLDAAAVVASGEVFPQVAFRPAYHDLLDSAAGFKEGSQIVFLETAFRYDPRRGKLRLEYLDAIDIVSIAPRSLFFRHSSWRVETGLVRRWTRGGGDPLLFDLGTGFGRAWDIQGFGLPYGMLETDVLVGGALDGSCSVGAGAACGILGNLTAGWRVHLLARGMLYRLGERNDRVQIGAGQNLRITRNASLAVEVDRIGDSSRWRTETKIGGRVFF